MKLVSVAQMREIEKQADAAGLSYSIMMENAGRGLASAVHAHVAGRPGRSVIALVGPGNNGGDALVALEYLARWGWHTAAVTVKARPSDPLVERLESSGGQVISFSNGNFPEIFKKLIGECSVLLDGLLGTGATLPLRTEYADLLSFAKQSMEKIPNPPQVIAVDCPSGIDCDQGSAPEQAIRADLTVTMAAAKQGLLSFPAASYVGKIQVVEIGNLEELSAWKSITRQVIEASWVRSFLPKRPLNAHKGTFGTAFICAGSRNYTGAAFLAGKAAYRCGAGLVTMAVAEPLYDSLAGHLPEATWVVLPHENGWLVPNGAVILRENLGRATALLLGPGWGLNPATLSFLQNILNQKDNASSLPPLVVDADGLKLLARLPDWPHQLPGVAILTPHPGEMSALCGLSTAEVNADRLAVAEQFAQKWGHVVILKGAFTVIASPDKRVGLIPIATPALARAGTGDVLAGLIVGLRAQGVEPFEAACGAAWIHAMAGVRTVRRLGAASVIAGDLLDAIPQIISELYGSDSLTYVSL